MTWLDPSPIPRCVGSPGSNTWDYKLPRQHCSPSIIFWFYETSKIFVTNCQCTTTDQEFKLSSKTYSPSTMCFFSSGKCVVSWRSSSTCPCSENAKKKQKKVIARILLWKRSVQSAMWKRSISVQSATAGKVWAPVLAKTIIDIKLLHWWWLYGPIWPLTTTSILLWINLCILTENATCMRK